jgi:hypothetical protein
MNECIAEGDLSWKCFTDLFDYFKVQALSQGVMLGRICMNFTKEQFKRLFPDEEFICTVNRGFLYCIRNPAHGLAVMGAAEKTKMKCSFRIQFNFDFDRRCYFLVRDLTNLLNGNSHPMQDNFRMSRQVFDTLVCEMVSFGLESARDVACEEMLCMFLYFAGQKGIRKMFSL